MPAGKKELLIGQFGAYKSSANMETGIHANEEAATVGAVYRARLDDIEKCMIRCTRKQYRHRLRQETRDFRRKLNATATQVNTYKQRGSHIQKEATFEFEAEKELRAQDLYQGVTDAFSKLTGEDTVMQELGG